MRRCLSTWAALGLALLGLVFVACPGPRAEGLIVNVQTDFAPLVEFDALRIQVDGADGRNIRVGPGESFGRPRFVTAYTSLSPGRHTLDVTLLHGGTLLVSRTIQVQFQSTYLATVVLTRSCAGRTCARDESCLGNRCVPSTCITGTEPTCPAPECEDDATCSTSTTCVEATCVTGACFQRPDDTRCPAQNVCVPGLGCEPVASDDAGLSDDDAFLSPDDDAFSDDAFLCTEGEVIACTTACGSSATQTCSGNAWTQCIQAEACNGQDDDCNGETDGQGLCPASESCVRGACVPCGILFSGETLLPGEARFACNATTELRHQADGNVVVYVASSDVWSTATNGEPTVGLGMQTDGNLVLRLADGTPRWYSGTNGHPGAYLLIRDDGVLELHEADGTPFWTPP